MHNTKEHIKQIIASDLLSAIDIFNSLLKNVHSADSSKYDLLILIKAQYLTAFQEYNQGTISYEQRDLVFQRVRKSLLDLHYQLPDTTYDSIVEANLQLNSLIKKVKSYQKEKLANICGHTKLFGISQPVLVDRLYVDVNILEEPNHVSRLEMEDLILKLDKDENRSESIESLFNRLHLNSIKERLPVFNAIDKHSHIMILGKPGSGKSTLLQHLAIKSNNEEFESERIPVFIRLRDYSNNFNKNDSFDLINLVYEECKLLSKVEVINLLNNGKILILLDGLDEVAESKIKEIAWLISKFAEEFYQNKIIITCRINSLQYQFHNFTYFEIADFSASQIKAFVKNYFQFAICDFDKENEITSKLLLSKCLKISDNMNFIDILELHSDQIDILIDREELEADIRIYTFIKKYQESLRCSHEFLNNLNSPDNWPIREIVVTPVLLSLTCAVFQHKKKFHSKNTQLYRDGINLLLSEWDDAKGVERRSFYQQLDIGSKKDLLIYIAAIKFEQQQYILFDEDEIIGYISKYLSYNFFGKFEKPVLKLSRDVLKEIEMQHGVIIERSHGIYSFSHLTFQEYFVSKSFLDGFNSDKLNKIADNIIDRKWWEVFRMTAESINSSDDLVQLTKQQIDTIISEDDTLQEFLEWIYSQSQSLSHNSSHKLQCIRGFLFYCGITLQRIFTPKIKYYITPLIPKILDKDFAKKEEDLLWIDINLIIAYVRGYFGFRWTYPTEKSTSPYLGYDYLEKVLSTPNINLIENASFKKDLEVLKQKIPSWQDNENAHHSWWKESNARESWSIELSDIILNYCNIGRRWNFNDKQIELLMLYHDAILMLVQFMNNAPNLSQNTKIKIEEALFLPFNQKIQS